MAAFERGGEGFRIRRLDSAQPGEKAILILRRDVVEAFRRGFALRDFLVGAAHQLQQRRLVLACDSRRLHRSNRHRKKLETHIYASTTIADAAKEFGISVSLIEKAKILVRDGAPHIIEMVARGDLGVVTAAEAARGLPRSEQQSWTRSRPRRAR